MNENTELAFVSVDKINQSAWLLKNKKFEPIDFSLFTDIEDDLTIINIKDKKQSKLLREVAAVAGTFSGTRKKFGKIKVIYKDRHEEYQKDYGLNPSVCILSGEFFHNSENLTNFLNNNNFADCCVSQISKDTIAIGALDFLFGKNRIDFRVKTKHKSESDKLLKYDDKLSGDCFGRMAYTMKLNCPVVNLVYKPIGYSFFYNRILSKNRLKEGKDECLICLPQTAEKIFPKEHISLFKAAQYYPVIGQIANHNILPQERLRFAIATHKEYGVVDTIAFLHGMSGSQFVWSYENSFPHSLPTFYGNCAINDRN